MIILVGSGASGKSRLARANEDFSFLEIQSDDKGWNIESCGVLHAINLNELGMDKAQKFINFIRENFGVQKFSSENWGEKRELSNTKSSKLWFVGETALIRMPYEKSKKWYICIKECTGDPRDNEECFEKINMYKNEDRKWNVGDYAYFRMPFERCRWYTCIAPCIGFPQENIECFK